MDFSKKDIHTSVLKESKVSQLTIDDDFNIPDSKKDVEKIIARNGNIVVEEISAEEGKVRIAGTVYFKILYKTVDEENSDLEVYQNEIPFEDNISIDGVNRSSRVEARCILEDLSVSIINSRKLEVRGLISNHVNVYDNIDVNCAIDLENGNGIECQYTKVDVTNTRIVKRDVFKIKEELELAQNKPNIDEILWSDIALRNIEAKSMKDKLEIRGEVEIFVIYKSNDEHMPAQYIFSVRSIVKEIECFGATEDMIVEADVTIGKGDMSVKPDADGEDRIIAVDYNVDMNIKLYEDEEIRLLSDMYSPQVEIEPDTESLIYENLLMKNTALVNVAHRHKLESDDKKVLQICHIYGDVFLDDVSFDDNQVNVEGIIKTYILFISSDDDPMDCIEVDIPFEHTVDTINLMDDYNVKVIPCLTQLSASLVNSQEIEIKAQVGLQIMVFCVNNMDVITDMTVSPIDYDKKAAMPGIAGYIVRKGDTIWSVARKYYATTESIRSVNNLENDEINEGDRLIVVKS
ncbi:MAG: DUF3794 domain-containing protein [Lachnospiraceae bacterium]|nr:DUF3794 domain-containing protein [Lachnospiraceae bacterium]